MAGSSSMMSDVAICRQAAVVPWPPLKLPEVGSQAMSPAAAITGSPAAGMTTVTWAVRAERLPEASNASTA